MSEKNLDVAVEKNSELEAVRVEIQRIYVKDQYCKVPHAPQAFQQADNKLEMATEMHINSQLLGKEIWEITLTISLTAKAAQSTVYTANVQQACIVKTNCIDEKQLSHLLNVHIPGILYPYIRKVIADAVFNAGFPPAFMPYVDFASMYQQRAQAAEKSFTPTLPETEALH